jgi:phage-related protein (TIGR01555 family)
MTRAGAEIMGELEPASLTKIETQATTLGIWNRVNETVKWARLYGGCIAVMLIDGQDTETPLRLNTIRKNQFRGLLVLDRWMVEPSLSDLVTELGPDIGKPKFYRVVASAPGLSQMKIHHSRCVRLEGIELPYWQRLMENMWGLSVIERLYDRMVAFDSASTGAAQLVYKSYMRTYKVSGMRELVAAGGDALKGLTAYVAFMRRFQSIEGITVIDANDDLATETHAAFGGLSDALAQFGQQLSGALQIPLVRLFGQSPSGFSTGETDLRNYYDTISQQQEKTLRVPLTRVYRAIAASEGIELPENFSLKFRSLWQLDDKTKAEIANSVSTAVSNVEGPGIIGRGTALKELKQSSEVTGIFTNISKEEIDEADNEGPPIPETVEVAQIHAGAQVEVAEKKAVAPPKPAAGAEKTEAPMVADAVRTMRARDSASRAAGIMFVTPDGQMLLLQRGMNGDCPGSWGLPGGRVETGESDEQAARREALEETGYDYPGTLRLLSANDGFATYVAEVSDTFGVSINNESTSWGWFKHQTNLHPGLANLLRSL